MIGLTQDLCVGDMCWATKMITVVERAHMMDAQRSVVEEFCREALARSVGEECCREELEKSVVEKCLETRFAEECRRRVL